MKKLALATLFLVGGCLDFDSLPGLYHGDLGAGDLSSGHVPNDGAIDVGMPMPPTSPLSATARHCSINNWFSPSTNRSRSI